VIVSGHRISDRSFSGREVVYTVDDLGLLVGFTPIEAWEGAEIPAEE